MRQLTRSIGDTIFENLGRAAGRVQENRPLPADVLESDDAFLVVFDAPGVTASDVQVRYVEDAVEARIDRFRDFHDGFEMVYPGRGLSLAGTATLPADAAVDTGSATASLRDDGTLRVRIPKAWDSVGAAEELEAEIDDTVEEADEREDAGTDVGEERDGDADDGSAADGGRQDETDAETDAGDGEADDLDEAEWERQDETDAEE